MTTSYGIQCLRQQFSLSFQQAHQNRKFLVLQLVLRRDQDLLLDVLRLVQLQSSIEIIGSMKVNNKDISK